MKQPGRIAANQLYGGVPVMSKKMPVVDTDGRFKTKNKKHSAKIIKKHNMVGFSVSKLFIECG